MEAGIKGNIETLYMTGCYGYLERSIHEMVAMMAALVTVGGTTEPDTSAMAMVAGSHDDGSGGDRFA
jgi:hypothetical protein